MTVADGSSVGGVAKEGEVSVWLLHSGNHPLASSEEESMIDGNAGPLYHTGSSCFALGYCWGCNNFLLMRVV